MKQPKWKGQPRQPEKVVKGAEKAEQLNAEKFQWRSAWVDLDGEWGFRNTPCDDLWKEIIPRLHEFESMTWGEIYGKRDGSTHPMPIDKIEPQALQRLKDIGKDQYDSVFQINIRGKIRIWGIRDRKVFYLIWHDPHHTVYKQKK